MKNEGALDLKIETNRRGVLGLTKRLDRGEIRL